MNYFFRLSRAQFLPVILTPVIVGTAAAHYSFGFISAPFLALAMIGSAFLHLAANIIDDVYDYVNGVDLIAERMFPPDFPGWKVLPRGVISVTAAKGWAYLSYLAGLAIGAYLSILTGLAALILALLGTLFSYFYVAPPLKLAYRGLGLGELAIFASFGPIPVLGAYYVQTLRLDSLPLLASVPLGLLTTCVLMNHDLIFHDPFREGRKISLSVRLGRASTIRLCKLISALCYAYVVVLVLLTITPLTSLLSVLAFPVFWRLLRVYSKKDLQIPDYAKATMTSFMHSVSFGLLLSVGFFLA